MPLGPLWLRAHDADVDPVTAVVLRSRCEDLSCGPQQDRHPAWAVVDPGGIDDVVALDSQDTDDACEIVIADGSLSLDRRRLERACGSGNFLEEILRRKLSTVTVRRYGHGERYEHRILRCLASIYAVDIDSENVNEARDRLRWVIASHVDNDLVSWSVSDGFASAVNTILASNIQQGDTLSHARCGAEEG